VVLRSERRRVPPAAARRQVRRRSISWKKSFLLIEEKDALSASLVQLFARGFGNLALQESQVPAQLARHAWAQMRRS
jgi:hypothetical protein